MKKYVIPGLLLLLSSSEPSFFEVQAENLVTGKVSLERLVNAEKSLTLDLSANRSGLYVIKCIFSDTTFTARVLLK